MGIDLLFRNPVTNELFDTNSSLIRSVRNINELNIFGFQGLSKNDFVLRLMQFVTTRFSKIALQEEFDSVSHDLANVCGLIGEINNLYIPNNYLSVISS